MFFWREGGGGMGEGSSGLGKHKNAKAKHNYLRPGKFIV